MPTPVPARGGPADVVSVLLLVQAATGLLAMAGQLLVMANPGYALAPLLKAVLLAVLAGQLRREARQWALVTTILLEWLGLFGVWAGVVLGLLPGIDPTLTVTGLLTTIGLPIAVIWLCAKMLGSDARRLPPTLALPVAAAR